MNLRSVTKRFTVVAGACSLVIACGTTTDSSSPSSDTTNGNTNTDSTPGTLVGPEGGTVSENGVIVTIPAGALATSTKIHVSESTVVPNGYTVSGKVYRFEPAGTHFAAPITIALPSSKPELVYWTVDGSEDVFEPVLTEFDEATASASVQISHFSGGFVGSSPTGITCTVKQPGACGTQRTTIESPAFWYVDHILNLPYSGPQAAIATDSIGINRYMNTQAGIGVLSPNADRTVWKAAVQNPLDNPATAQVSINTITSFTASATRGGSTAGNPCPGGTGVVAPTVQYTCSGGNVTIGYRAPIVDAGVPVVDSGIDSSSSDDSGVADSGIDSSVEDSGVADDSGVDSSLEDSGIQDSSVTDSGAAVDSGVADSGAPTGITCVVSYLNANCDVASTTTETPKFWYVSGNQGQLASDSYGLNLALLKTTVVGSPLYYASSPYEYYQSDQKIASQGIANVSNGTITSFTADTKYLGNYPICATKPGLVQYAKLVTCSGGNVKILSSKP